MFEDDKLDQQKYRQKADTGDAACLGVDTIKSVDSIDAEDSSSNETDSQKPLRHGIDHTIDDKFLRTETAYPDSQKSSEYMSD